MSISNQERATSRSNAIAAIARYYGCGQTDTPMRWSGDLFEERVRDTAGMIYGIPNSDTAPIDSLLLEIDRMETPLSDAVIVAMKWDYGPNRLTESDTHNACVDTLHREILRLRRAMRWGGVR